MYNNPMNLSIRIYLILLGPMLVALGTAAPAADSLYFPASNAGRVGSQAVFGPKS
jgi:hypothetical protein